MDGSITSAPTINSGGTLSGHGSVGSITLTSGGFLAPGGSSYGTLHAASLLWDSGGQLQFTLGQATPDLLLISGELAKDSTSNGTYTFDFSNGGVQAGETFDLVKGTGGFESNFVLSDFSYISNNQFAGSFGYSATDNALTFTVNSVAPKPSTWALLLGSLLLFGTGVNLTRKSARTSLR